MSEIQYVNRLGDALDAMAVASAPASGRPSGRRLPRFRSGRSRLLVGLAVVLVSGGVATAATLLSRGPTVLAARGLTCEPGAPGDYTGATLGIEEGARTPTAACAAVDRVRASKLIACASAKFGVVVYHRDGDPSECADAAMGSLPVGYTAAAKRVATLIRDLNRLQASQNCFTQSSLVAATQSTLNTLGFIGWHARISRPPGDTHPSAWRCAQYPASGLRLSDAASAISYDYSGRSRVVAVVSGPSRRTDRAIEALGRRELYVQTGTRCYSLSGIQSLVRAAVLATFGAGTPVRFAATAEPPSTTLGLRRQPRYSAGCAILVGYGPTPQGEFQAQIWQKGWPAQNASDGLPKSAYKPLLRGP